MSEVHKVKKLLVGQAGKTDPVVEKAAVPEGGNRTREFKTQRAIMRTSGAVKKAHVCFMGVFTVV